MSIERIPRPERPTREASRIMKMLGDAAKLQRRIPAPPKSVTRQPVLIQPLQGTTLQRRLRQILGIPK